MKYRMLAIDLDGTLLDSHGRISPGNRAAIHAARDAGVLIVLCTGRGLTESRGAIRDLDHHGPIVLAGGAHVSDPTTGRTLHRAIIEPSLAGRIIQHLDPETHAVIALLDPEPWGHDYLVVGHERLTANTRWWFEMIGARLRRVPAPTEEDLHHILRVGIVATGSTMPVVQSSVETHFTDRVMVQHFQAVTDPRDRHEPIHILEVFAAGVNKWSGLQWLAEQHAIAPDRIAAIGDQINDLAMIQSAACGVAMGNAVESVRLAASRQTAPNDEDGVAHAIARMLAGDW